MMNQEKDETVPMEEEVRIIKFFDKNKKENSSILLFFLVI